MKMLTKFESRSSRAKAVAFHPTRSWVLAALYSSTIQLWDYRMGVVLDRFEGHAGPVRGLDVHPDGHIFVSCGDDATVRVWSLDHNPRQLFVLKGHFDYVRTAFFHSELPWIVTASDDQTVRIWNWQSRQEIATLTGHNHWVSCAKFHPSEDLVVSGSMDTMVRVWDISGLRKRLAPVASSASGASSSGLSMGLQDVPLPPGMGPQGQGGMMGGPQDDDLFSTDVVTKFVLQGHSRSVTCIDIHPTLNLIASASDDRTVRLWRLSESRAWEIDACRGHSDDVTGVAFSPFQDLLLSCSADRSIRAWDVHKRSQIQTWRRDNDKFWGIVFHPRDNLVGAPHDGGIIVFKLARERSPLATMPDNGLVWASAADKSVYTSVNGQVTKVLTLKNIGPEFEPFRDISYNPAERAVLLSWDGGWAMAKLSGREPTTGDKAWQAMFVSRNRFAVLAAKGDTTLTIKDMDGATTKTIELPIATTSLAPTPDAGHILLLGSKSVVRFDIQTGRVIARLATPAGSPKYVSWSPQGAHVVLQHRHALTIADARLRFVATLRETIRIKSVAWDSSGGVIVYTTFNHLKYALLNGDAGVLCTTPHTLYAVSARGTSVTALNRAGQLENVTVDPTEWRFKRALISGNFGEVARLIKTSQLVGQAIIAYLQQRGHPEIALEFVDDHRTRLDLAVESGNLDIASTEAKALGTADADALLAQAAREQGNHDLLEDVYQRQHEFDKLAMLYLVTGHRSRLQRLSAVAEQRGDVSAQFQTSLFLGDVQTRIALLEKAGLQPLAWALAKSHGIAYETDNDTSKISVSDLRNVSVPGITHETYKKNWPVKHVEHRSILEAVDNLSIEDIDGNGGNVMDGTTETLADDADDDLGDEWDLNVDIEAPPEGAAEVTAESATEAWLRGSHVAADHIAAGSFETAAQLLNRQAGVVLFEPLKPRFLAVYNASKLYLTAHEALAPLPFYVLRGRSQPFIPGFESLQHILSEGFAQVKAAQLEAAVDSFRSAIYTVITLAVATESEADECRRVLETARNYILALTIELKRRALPADDVKRNLELAAYFTKPKLRAQHATLPLRVALMQAFKAKAYVLASHFAGQYLKLEPRGPGADKVRRIKATADANPLDVIDIDFDAYADFDICPSTLTPIYQGQPVEYDPLTKAPYHASQKGVLDTITQITQVGAAAAGLRLF